MSQPYSLAKRAYAKLGVDTDLAIRATLKVPISLHCWQGDDVGGFEVKEQAVDGGGIMATGNYPGRARNGGELRADLAQVLALLPGKQLVNLHAIYAETGGKRVDRDKLKPEHFAQWIAWAKRQRIGLDFNPTFFAHHKANDGFTLSHADPATRAFWIRHGIRGLLDQERSYLAPGGLLLLEIEASLGQAVQTLARSAFPHARLQVLSDLAGLDRLVRIEN